MKHFLFIAPRVLFRRCAFVIGLLGLALGLALGVASWLYRPPGSGEIIIPIVGLALALAQVIPAAGLAIALLSRGRAWLKPLSRGRERWLRRLEVVAALLWLLLSLVALGSGAEMLRWFLSR